MSIVPTNFGAGGVGIHRGHGDPDLKTILFDMITDLGNLLAAAGGEVRSAGRVHHGGLVTDPTTASSQLTGAGGVTEWRVNVSLAEAIVNSVDGLISASADEVIHDTTNLLDAVGEACYAAVLLVESGGSISISSVKGTPAVAASAVAPTDAEIDTGVGHANWIRLAVCYLERDGDTSVTQSQVNAGYGKATTLSALLSIQGT